MTFQNLTKLAIFRRFRLISKKKNPKTPNIFISLENLNFTCESLKDSTLICQIYDFEVLKLSQTEIN